MEHNLARRDLVQALLATVPVLVTNEAVDALKLVARVEQLLDEQLADEAGGARHQNALAIVKLFY